MNFQLTTKGRLMFPDGELKARFGRHWGLTIDFGSGGMENMTIATNATEIRALYEMGIITFK